MSQNTHSNTTPGRINIPVRNAAKSTAAPKTVQPKRVPQPAFQSFELLQDLERAQSESATLDQLLIKIAERVAENTESLSLIHI